MTVHRKPDPARGVFETMLVVRGTPVAPEAHLSRLEASLRDLYGMELPAPARQLVGERAGGLELGRLRLTVAPAILEVEAGELDRSLHFPDRPLSLRPHAVSGGLGCHKWVDRAAIPSSRPGEAPLLVDSGEVLEVGWANVFAVRGGTLFTPPLDGRLLPGVTRSTVIELAREQGVGVAEKPLALAELQEAEEVFLTNSIRGIEVAGSVNGRPLLADRPLTRSLVGALRSGWENEAAARRRPLRTSV